MSEIVIYEQKGRSVEVKLDGDTVWLTQKQISEVLDTSSNNIGMHINRIYADKELGERATTKDSLVVQTEGKRSISRKVKHYNLDMIISVAYRVNSKRVVGIP